MISGLATRTINTPNQGSRGGATIQYIVLHHMATTGFQGVLNSWATGSKEGSANYAIDTDGEVVGVVPEESRSWSLSNAAFDSKSITFEIANSSVGGSWPVSDAATESTARVVADIARRHGIPLTRDRVIGHREVYTRFGVGYSTACPGGLDLDRIVARANQLITESAGLATTPLEPEMTPEQSRKLDAIYDALFNGGPSMKDNGKSVSQSLAEISGTVNKNVLRDTNGDGANEEISQIQDNADTNSLVRQLISRGPAGTNAPIDYTAIGAAVRNAIIKP